MRTLAIDCATEACSAALFDGTQLVDSRYEVLGRGHAERLVPMIRELPDRGQAERILVSLGPGSFTGVRIGIAAARALGLAWGAEVLGYPALALVAAIARADSGISEDALAFTVCMNGGHGEWFIQSFNESGLPENGAASLTPEAAVAHVPYARIAGNRASDFVQKLGDTSFQAFPILPDASRTTLLPDAVLTHDLTPIYGRAPDAKPQIIQQ